MLYNNNIKLNHILFNLNLPDDIIINILLFDNYIWIEGKLQKINKIKKNDRRYKVLQERPLIFIYKNSIEYQLNKKPNNSITIYNNILDKSIIEQYNYIYKSIHILRHF